MSFLITHISIGVGDPAVLSQFDIETVVELPGVGANLQEHVWSGVQWELKDGITTFGTSSHSGSRSMF